MAAEAASADVGPLGPTVEISGIGRTLEDLDRDAVEPGVAWAREAERFYREVADLVEDDGGDTGVWGLRGSWGHSAARRTATRSSAEVRRVHAVRGRVSHALPATSAIHPRKGPWERTA
jgi:hypothetical protein